MGSRPWRRSGVPPMPALIPIAALRSGGGPAAAVLGAAAVSPRADNNNVLGECSPCERQGASCEEASEPEDAGSECEDEVRCSASEPEDAGRGGGEQERHERSRRQAQEGAEPARRPRHAIDETPSRDAADAEQAPTRRPRPERHRKSDRRRREHRSDRLLRKRSASASSNNNNNSADNASPDARQPPRVNPIFVWIRQEDTRIVDVRCEDYDKRNRILLTKTAHGWRAIPRTETLTTTLEETPARQHHEHRHERSKSGPGRPRRKKRATRDRGRSDPACAPVPSPVPSPVSSPVRDPEDAPPVDSASVNSAVAQAPLCRATNDASPLDKLLAVAELEFEHQVRAETSPSPAPPNHALTHNAVNGQTQDCDYNEEDDEDENHFSDVLDRLEQSLQSPNEIETEENPEEEMEEEGESCHATQDVAMQEDPEEDEVTYVPEQEQETIEIGEQSPEVAMEIDKIVEEEQVEADEEVEEEEEDEEEGEEEQFYDSLTEKCQDVDAQKDACEQPTDLTLKSKSIEEDIMPTDLSKKKETDETCESVEAGETAVVDDMMPTDLSIRKHLSPALTIEAIPRPPSQNSETIQSPQPSGIPAVPPSPDIFPAAVSVSARTAKSVFLESLLSASPKLALNPELTITRNQKEPLDLGKGRKSASPTVTCSEEAKHIGEPPPKRIKMEDITLKNLLHAEDKKPDISIKPVIVEKKSVSSAESSRLLELLTADESVTQLRQLLADPRLHVPDPLLVPKDLLGQLILAPAIHIPRLLVSRPELRIPDIFMYPKLMRDNDILVISMEQLKNIIEKNVPIPLAELEITKALKKLDSPKQPVVEKQEKHEPKAVMKPNKPREPSKESVMNQQALSSEYQRYAQSVQQQQQQLAVQEAQLKQQSMSRKGLAGDIDAATTAAFNQMMWLPYLNQLEAAAMATGNQQDFMKMLNTVFPPGGYPPPFPEPAPHMYGAARFAMPAAFPLPAHPPIEYNPNALELAMWQEAMLRQKMPMQENLKYKESIDKRNYQMMMNKNKINHNNQHIEQVLNNQKKNGFSAEQQYLNSVQQQLLNGQLHPNNIHLLSGHYQNGHHQNGHYNGHVQQEKYKETLRNQQFKASEHQQQKQNMGPPLSNAVRANIQIPHYNSTLSQAANQKPVVSKTKEDNFSKIFKYGNPFLSPKQKQELQEQKQELRIPPRLPRTQNPPSRNPGEPHKPIDLSDTKKKLKEASILDAHFRKYATREDIAEVGSTTEEMSGHEAQTHHVWNPLFGK